MNKHLHTEELARFKRLLTKFNKDNIDSDQLEELNYYVTELKEAIKRELFDRENEC